MRTEKFKDLFWFGPKSNIKAGDGLNKGRFPFYTSSPKLTKWIDREQHFDETLIFGTGGLASVHFEDQPFSTSTDCIVAITTNKEIKTKFVFYYLFGNIHLLERGFKGAGLKHISKKYIENLDIPVLPIETQNKIVAILDKASALITKREESIAMLNELLKATFLYMFGDPSNNQFNFPKGQIRDVAAEVKYGTSSPAEDKGEYPYIRMNNITYQGYWDFSSLKYINIRESEKDKYLVKKGDLLFNRTNSKELVGKTAVYSENREMVIAGYLIRVRTNEKANPWFLWGYLNSYHGKRTLFGMCKSIVGMANINAQELQNIEIVIPPIAKQNKFATLVKTVLTKKIKTEFSLSLLKDFNAALMQRVFNGQLNFNVDFELDALIKEIDLQNKENDLSKITGDIAYLQRLVDKLNNQEFKEKDLYDKAKHGVFQMMAVKEEEIKVIQEYDENSKSLKLALK